jgi:acyl-homoserine-lactone acylase
MNKMQLTSFNVLYADRFDTIFYVSNALLPKRSPGYNYVGTVSGNTCKTLWTQYHPFSDLPQQVNPQSGYLYNTNHSPFRASAIADNLDSASYPSQMNFTKRENNRSVRFREIMPDSGKISYEQLKQLKYDGRLPKTLAYRTDMNILFNLDTLSYPDISKQINALKKWDKTTGISSEGAAIFAFQYYFWRDIFRKENRDINTPLSESEAVLGLRQAKSHFLVNFKKEIVTLGEYQKLVRGDRSFPLWGIDDVLTSIKSQPWENGMRKGTHGESYIMMIRFGAGLPKIETINVYGASNKKGKPHYDDQMKLFLQQKLKPMSLDKEEVLDKAKTIYNPGLTRAKK